MNYNFQLHTGGSRLDCTQFPELYNLKITQDQYKMIHLKPIYIENIRQIQTTIDKL